MAEISDHNCLRLMKQFNNICAANFINYERVTRVKKFD